MAEETKISFDQISEEETVLSTLISDEEMTVLYERIRARLRGGIECDGISHSLVTYGGMLESGSSSFGAPRTLYDCLLHAYTESKRYRNGELVIYNESRADGDGLSERVATVHDIRKSLHMDFDGFYLLHQPVFKAPGEKPVGAQSCLMWRGDDGTSLNPEDFLPEISHDAVFDKLGYWFIKKALCDGGEFTDADPNFRLYLPITPNFIEDRYFADNVTEIASETKFPLTNLSMLLMKEFRLAPIEKQFQFVSCLKAKGIKIGLDDFALGPDWLKAFRELSPDFVRFPASITEHIAEDGKDMTIFSHLADMVKSCGTEIFARGVDEDRIRDILFTLSLDGIQGDSLMKFSFYDEVLDLYVAENADHQ